MPTQASISDVAAAASGEAGEQLSDAKVVGADDEFKAMSLIVKRLSAMDEPTRKRVMAYLVARFGG